MTDPIKRERPLISVIVPVYNIKEYLPACLDSLTAQTYGEIEILVVDDGSTDGSCELCDLCAQKDPRIRVIHKTNGGLSDARNAGIEAASGTYIGFVDGDDRIAPDMYEALAGCLLDSDAGISVCGYYVWDGERITETRSHTPGVLSGESAIRRAIREGLWDVVAWNKLYKKELFDEIRFPYGELFEDAAVYYKLWLKAGRIAYTDAVGYYYRIRPGSITGTEKALGRSEISLKHLDEEERYFKENCPALVPDIEAVILEQILLLNVLYLQSGRPDGEAYRAARKRFERNFRGILRLKTLGFDKKFKAVLMRAGLYGPVYRLLKGRR